MHSMSGGVVKSSNLTVRIDPDLKRDAQAAAAALDVSLSQVVSAALRGLIRQATAHKSWVAEFVIPAPVESIELIGESEGDAAGRRKVLDRIELLTDREKRNSLNKDTRRELAHLRKVQARW